MTSTKSALPTVLKTDTKGRVHTPAAERDAILDLFEQGGMSGAASARLHGIRYPTFAHWRKQRRERHRTLTYIRPKWSAAERVACSRIKPAASYLILLLSPHDLVLSLAHSQNPARL